ncbi:helix-turn-helix transcriptional regulator [Thalassotalea psychrophila]|uniref:Helix-turn-helix transcriptional regulator n=1 Tax=Thalassotalea psychrophila TaxID=3065647 RepID=A0ABY9TXC5_9GAMM|nr:helix-turn-helix transcriptional regulator [Colwelliaceae bacterium SQ149]
MLQHLNKLILDIYQKSFYHDLISFRDEVCALLCEKLSFDTISWNYIDNEGNKLGAICVPNLIGDDKKIVSIESSKGFSEQLLLDKKQKVVHTSLVSIEQNGHYLIATVKANQYKRGHQIALIRNSSMPTFNEEDKKLFELMFPHLVEGLSISLLNSVQHQHSRRSIALLDKNNNIIEASAAFIDIFSSKIKNNQVLSNLNIAKQEKLTIDGKHLTVEVKPLSEFYLVEISFDKTLSLTAQEGKIMQLLITGASNKTMADALQISPSTINNHITNIFNKLDVNSRIEAVKEWNKYAKS